LVVYSPYQRARRTACIVMDDLSQNGVPLIPDEEWLIREFTYLSYNEYSTVQDRQPIVDLFWAIADPSWVDGPGTESFEQFIDRVSKFKARLESTELHTVAIFSHEQFISAFLWLLKKG